MGAPRRELTNTKVARALAAMTVVLFHCFFAFGQGILTTGSWGLDLFFVISGFIIAYVTMENPEHFLAKRLIRIVPFYWAATFTLFAVANLAPASLPNTPSGLIPLLYSLFFAPLHGWDGAYPASRPWLAARL